MYFQTYISNKDSITCFESLAQCMSANAYDSEGYSYQRQCSWETGPTPHGALQE